MLGTKAYSESYAYSDSEGTGGTITTTATVFVYTYDTAGNIRSETKTTGGTATTKSYTYGDALWKDLLTKVGITSITYDDSGNPLNWYNGKKTYSGLTWEQGRQLARLSVGGTAIHYEYDADGIRAKMSAGGMTFMEAYVWASAADRFVDFKKRDAWGLYTVQKGDAYIMALALGSFAEPFTEEYTRAGFYEHYHTSRHKFQDYFKYFHVWYGEPT